jgi:hypothetical protein
MVLDTHDASDPSWVTLSRCTVVLSKSCRNNYTLSYKGLQIVPIGMALESKDFLEKGIDHRWHEPGSGCKG